MDTNNTIDDLVEEIFFKKVKEFFNSDVSNEFSQLSHYLISEVESRILCCISEIKDEIEDTSEKDFDRFNDEFFNQLNTNINSKFKQCLEHSLTNKQEALENIIESKLSIENQIDSLKNNIDLQARQSKEWLDTTLNQHEQQRRIIYDDIILIIEQRVEKKISGLEKEIISFKRNYLSEKEAILLHVSNKHNIVLGKVNNNSIYLIILIAFNFMIFTFLILDKLKIINW